MRAARRGRPPDGLRAVEALAAELADGVRRGRRRSAGGCAARAVAPVVALRGPARRLRERPAAGAADVRVNGGPAGPAPPSRPATRCPTRRSPTPPARPSPAQDAADGVTLVFFGYSHCPDICNVVLANLAPPCAARRRRCGLDPVLFVTTDPARDTPTVVRDYLDRFDPAFDGLVAPVAHVEQAAKELHVSYERPDGSTGGYEVDHGTYTTRRSSTARRPSCGPDTTAVADLRADLRRLAD